MKSEKIFAYPTMYFACSNSPPRPPWPMSANGVSSRMNLQYSRSVMPGIGASSNTEVSQGSGHGYASSSRRPSSSGALVAWNSG